MQNDPDNPLFPSLGLQRAAIVDDTASRAAEIQHCRARVSRESFSCQMAAKSLLELLGCRRAFGPGAERVRAETPVGEGGSKNTIIGPGETSPAPVENTPRPAEPSTVERLDQREGAATTTGDTATVSSKRVAVNAANCGRAYDHLYQVMTGTPKFKKRPDRARLQQYWTSREARDSFAARCAADFRPEDLGCVLSTSDPDVVQGCLLVVPG